MRPPAPSLRGKSRESPQPLTLRWGPNFHHSPLSRRPTSCNLNWRGKRGVNRHHLCKMLLVSMLACQMFFVPCLPALRFTILVSAQQGVFLLTGLPVAPFHPFQELSLLAQVSSRTLPSPFSQWCPRCTFPAINHLCCSHQHTLGMRRWDKCYIPCHLSQWVFLINPS